MNVYKILNLSSAVPKRVAAVALAMLLVFAFGFSPMASAALTNASLNLDDARPGVTTTYTFGVSTVNTGTDIGCIQIDLGANSDGSGAITGLDTSGSSLDSNSIASGFSVDNTGSANHVLEASGTPVTPSASGTIVFGGVDNGTTADTGYFAVFSTFEDTNCTTLAETITVQFIYTDGQAVSATIDPNFTFTVVGLANAVDVNGTNTTEDASSSPDEIPFGTVTTSANSIVGQELTINTNAQNGYSIYVQYTGQLENAADTYQINDFSGPAAFSAAGTENFGFTTEDEDVITGTDWDGLTTSQQQIATRATALTAAETTEVAYQLGAGTNTPAGEYDTVVIYTAVPLY